MSFLKSIVFGSEGSYTIFGTNIHFERELPSQLTPPGRPIFIPEIAINCFQSRLFQCLSQRYIHLVAHELTHALAFKIFTGKNSNIFIFTNRSCAFTRPPTEANSLENWKITVSLAAGPMGNIAFSYFKLIGATALKKHLPWPIFMVLAGSAVIWITGELIYASVSALAKDHGDFGQIRLQGPLHLTLATITMVSELALGIILAVKLLR